MFYVLMDMTCIFCCKWPHAQKRHLWCICVWYVADII